MAGMKDDAPPAPVSSGRPRGGVLTLTGLVILSFACASPYGIYHTVEPGQTLYRICKTYHVPMQQVAELNEIDDPTRISVGQSVFIPGADYEMKVDIVGRTLDPGDPKPGTERKPEKKPAVRKPTTPNGAGSKPTAETASAEDDYEPGKEIKKSKGKFIWPLKGPLISKFGIRDGEAHDGLDIKAEEGASIVAADDGKVIYADDGLAGYGNLIIIKHEGTFATVYAHNKENLVKKGDFVEKGQKIALVGDTGRATTPHLHFEVREKSKPRNPMFFLP